MDEGEFYLAFLGVEPDFYYPEADWFPPKRTSCASKDGIKLTPLVVVKGKGGSSCNPQLSCLKPPCLPLR